MKFGLNIKAFELASEEYFRSHTKAHPAAFFQGTPKIYTSVLLTPRTNIAVTIEGEDKDWVHPNSRGECKTYSHTKLR